MNYKKIIPSRRLRIKLLRIFDRIPDKLMLRIEYLIKTGRLLHLEKPKRLSEKLQWYKLYYKDPIMAKCVDKYEVRNFIIQKGYEDILIPCYGVYSSLDDINFENLPNNFVAKDTLGGGGSSVILVKDKNTINHENLKSIFKEWLKFNPNSKNPGREWVYENKPHKIIIEKLIEDPLKKTLIDYKFFCFNGKVGFLYYMADRTLGDKVKIGIFDRNFNLLKITRNEELPLDYIPQKPKNYDLMLSIAEDLSSDFPHVRVDLYNIDGKIYFGELTFFNGSGYLSFSPDEADYYFGQMFHLPKKRLF